MVVEVLKVDVVRGDCGGSEGGCSEGWLWR